MTRKGEHHSEESKKKMKESSKKRWAKPEERARNSNLIKDYYRTHDNPNKGKHNSEEANKKMSEIMTKHWQENPHPMLGKTHTPEARAKISAVHKGKIIPPETRLKMSEGHLLYYQNPENRKKKSETAKKTIQDHPELLLNLYRGWNPAGGIRKDLGHYVRSKWEANVARVLIYENEPYEFEKHQFKLDDGSVYIPDFYLPYQDFYIEVKGYWWEKGRRKFLNFKKQYPNINLVVLDENLYIYLKNMYRKIIPNWED